MANYKSKKRSYKRRRKYTLKGGMGMGAPPGALPAPGAPGAPPGAPGAKGESELVKTKKKLSESNKKVKKLEKEIGKLELDNNELRNKLIGVSEDIVILQRDLPMINDTVENLIKKINLYQVHQQEKEKQKSKNNKNIEMTVNPKGPYFTKGELEKPISEYKSHLNSVAKSTVGKPTNKLIK